jgi:flagellar basal-body rod modification protein FlgD
MSIIPATGSTGSSTATAKTATTDSGTLAGNFTTFLTLLTTQLKNQNPLEPLDTNQFTAQLVQFASVEQQMKQNEQLTNLVALSKAADATTSLAFVGATVVVDGSTAAMGETGGANWMFNVTKPASATMTIKDSAGQTVYTGKIAVNPGDNKFTWDGRGNDGKAWPAGNYTLTATAVDASNNNVAISTEIQATVESVDLTADPPLLMIAGKEYTADKIKRVMRYQAPAETPPAEES